MRISALTLAIGLLVASPIPAEEAPAPAGCDTVEVCGDPGCCGHCGRRCNCGKYCTVVPYVKEVKKTVWVVKCEDFCAPLPRLPRCGGDDCGQVPDAGQDSGCNCERGCKACDVCAVEQSKCQVPPKCGPVRCKKVLQKKEVVCKVPSYKCVVTYCCQACNDSGAAPAVAPSPGGVKPAPAPQMKKLPPPPKSVDLAPLPSQVGAALVP